LVEVWVDADMKMQYKLNGVSSDYASLPLSLNGLTLEQGDRSIREDNHRNRALARLEGTCFDDPGGQVNIDIAQGYESQWNLNVKIEASVDAVTMQANDQFSLCSTWFDPNWKTRRYRHVDWNVKLVAPEDSLFTIGSEMCAGCNSKLKWGYSTVAWGKIADNAKLMCAAHPEKEGKEITLGSVCKSANNGAGIDIDDAAAACASLQVSQISTGIVKSIIASMMAISTLHSRLLRKRRWNILCLFVYQKARAILPRSVAMP